MATETQSEHAADLQRTVYCDQEMHLFFESIEFGLLLKHSLGHSDGQSDRL